MDVSIIDAYIGMIYIYIHTYIHTLHYITLHYITLHYITLHYITLHYITLHYITLHIHTIHTYETVYVSMCMYTYIYICINCVRVSLHILDIL